VVCGVVCGMVPSRGVQTQRLRHRRVCDLVCCGVNIGRQFPLTADIHAIVVVFVDTCLRVSMWVKGGR
jgi:hypothetical protein